MSHMPAARVGDDVAHSNAMSGLMKGLVIGVAVGVLVGATIATGGGALAVVAGVGAAGGLASAGGLAGAYIGGASMGPSTGKFVTGSPNVFVNGRPATMTLIATAACSKEGGAPIPLATGSSSVLVNMRMAGREGETLGCSAVSVKRTSPDVLIGGASAGDPAVTITPEIPPSYITALQVVGFAGAVMALPFAIATVGLGATIGGGVLGFVGGKYGAQGGRALGEALGMSEAGIRSLEVAGGFLGGMVGGVAGTKGGQAGQARYNNWRANRAIPTADRVPRGVPLSQAEFDKVRSTPRGLRPPPEDYLPASYRESHLKQFDDGGSYLVRTKTLDDFGRDPLGRPDGQFIVPKSEMDGLIARTGGDIGKIEIELGIPPGAWNKPGETLSRIDIPDPRSLDVRLPSGNEGGANPLWMPGGKLPGGGSEAVVNKIPGGRYIETVIGKRK